MYSYDRRVKTAAKMDVHDKWRDIVDKHAAAEQKDFQGLLKDLVPYLKSVGYDLDVNKSEIGKTYHGSDGVRRMGTLVLTEREENTVKAEKPDQVAKWVAEATGMHGSATKIGEKQTPRGTVFSWSVDIGEY